MRAATAPVGMLLIGVAGPMRTPDETGKRAQFRACMGQGGGGHILYKLEVLLPEERIDAIEQPVKGVPCGRLRIRVLASTHSAPVEALLVPEPQLALLSELVRRERDRRRLSIATTAPCGPPLHGPPMPLRWRPSLRAATGRSQ